MSKTHTPYREKDNFRKGYLVLVKKGGGGVPTMIK